MCTGLPARLDNDQELLQNKSWAPSSFVHRWRDPLAKKLSSQLNTGMNDLLLEFKRIQTTNERLLLHAGHNGFLKQEGFLRLFQLGERRNTVISLIY